MSTPRRRKTDNADGGTEPSVYPTDVAPADAAAWTRACATRLTQAQPGLEADEARQLATALHEFERTGTMEVDAAVHFVTTEMRKHSPRFERRSAAFATETESASRDTELH
jgi:hypothetical protein